jgi:hypothetical protein
MYGMRYAGEGNVYVAAWGRRVDMRRMGSGSLGNRVTERRDGIGTKKIVQSDCIRVVSMVDRWMT